MIKGHIIVNLSLVGKPSGYIHSGSSSREVEDLESLLDLMVKMETESYLEDSFQCPDAGEGLSLPSLLSGIQGVVTNDTPVDLELHVD